MSRKTDAHTLIVLFVLALVAAFCTLSLPAHATGKPETPATPSSTSSAHQVQHQTQAQQQAIDLSLMNAPAGASIRQGNSYALTSGAAPLPPGLCPDSSSHSYGFGAAGWSTNRTDLVCLRMVLDAWIEVSKLAQPKPVEVRYVSISPPPRVEAPAECKAPEAKRAKAAKKTAAAKPADDSCKRG